MTSSYARNQYADILLPNGILCNSYANLYLQIISGGTCCQYGILKKQKNAKFQNITVNSYFIHLRVIENSKTFFHLR